MALRKPFPNLQDILAKMRHNIAIPVSSKLELAANDAPPPLPLLTVGVFTNNNTL